MIVGNEKQREYLKKISKAENIPHALLFSGPEKIGKKLIALEFIKNVFCEKQDGHCGQCYSCRSIESNAFPDLAMISPLDGNIAIEQVRDLQRLLSLKSYNNSTKAGIIDDAHLMRKDAQNAILKTLEEPIGDTVLILITPYPEMLLKTIRSRIEQVKFSLVPRSLIEKELESRGCDKDTAKEISIISSGQVGKAIDFFEDRSKLKFFNDAIDAIARLVHSGYFERFTYAKSLNENPEDILRVLDIWERFFRREMLLRVLNNKGVLIDYSLKKTKDALDNISKTKYLVSSTNTNKKLALENLLIEI